MTTTTIKTNRWTTLHSYHCVQSVICQNTGPNNLKTSSGARTLRRSSLTISGTNVLSLSLRIGDTESAPVSQRSCDLELFQRHRHVLHVKLISVAVFSRKTGRKPARPVLRKPDDRSRDELLEDRHCHSSLSDLSLSTSSKVLRLINRYVWTTAGCLRRRQWRNG